MAWDNAVVLILNLVSFGISASIGWACLGRKRVRGAKAYAYIAFGQATWTFGSFWELASRTLDGKIFWDNFQYIGVCGWGISFLAFSVIYSGRRAAHPRIGFMG